MIKEVLTIGDDRLAQVSVDVTEDEFGTPELEQLIMDMLDTMRYRNGVGIAAVQIGVLKRIALIEYDVTNPRYSNIGSCPLTVVINPKIEAIGDEMCERNEGCLSVTGVRGDVLRPKHIRYSFYDQTGKLISGESDQFFARVMQHEIDHMNGILFPMRIESMKNN